MSRLELRGIIVAGSTIMENETYDVFLIRTDRAGNAESPRAR